jgi:hypothetical protein
MRSLQPSVRIVFYDRQRPAVGAGRRGRSGPARADATAPQSQIDHACSRQLVQVLRARKAPGVPVSPNGHTAFSTGAVSGLSG